MFVCVASPPPPHPRPFYILHDVRACHKSKTRNLIPLGRLPSSFFVWMLCALLLQLPLLQLPLCWFGQSLDTIHLFNSIATVIFMIACPSYNSTTHSHSYCMPRVCVDFAHNTAVRPNPSSTMPSHHRFNDKPQFESRNINIQIHIHTTHVVLCIHTDNNTRAPSLEHVEESRCCV